VLVSTGSKRYGLKINGEETKTMAVGQQRVDMEIKLDSEKLQQVFHVSWECHDKRSKVQERHKEKNWHRISNGE